MCGIKINHSQKYRVLDELDSSHPAGYLLTLRQAQLFQYDADYYHQVAMYASAERYQSEANETVRVAYDELGGVPPDAAVRAVFEAYGLEIRSPRPATKTGRKTSTAMAPPSMPPVDDVLPGVFDDKQHEVVAAGAGAEKGR